MLYEFHVFFLKQQGRKSSINGAESDGNKNESGYLSQTIYKNQFQVD